MTAHTKLTVLDRTHTLLVVLLGSAAAIATMTAIPKPQPEATQFLWMVVGLAVGYGTSYITDVVFTVTVRRFRKRLLDATKTTDPVAGS